MEGVANLIAEAIHENEYAQQIGDPERREIFVSVESISRNEFFDAGRNGINPELKFITPSINYNCEGLIEYEGDVFTIYRTYEQGENVEIYAQKKVGNLDE